MLLQRKNYLLRNYRTSDFGNLFKLYREAEISDLSGAFPASAQLQERLERRPHFNPQEDILVIEERGKIVAFMEMAREKYIKRLVLSCLVHPLHRGTGLASMLLDGVFNRAKDLEVQHIHVQAARHNLAAQKVLRRLGFYHVRTFLELRAKANWILPACLSMGEGYCLRNLQHGEEALLAHLQNSCFKGSWGYNPNTPEDIYYATSLKNCSIHDVVAVFRGKQAIAYCWNVCEPEDARGRIHMLGVLPGHRGKGIASRVLRAGVSLLCRRGKKVVELTSDLNNIPASRLYFSAGFKTWSETLWYEISLSPE